jgi:hypothetical protein
LWTNTKVLTTGLVKPSELPQILITGLVKPSGLPQRCWLQGWWNPPDYHKGSDYRADKMLEITTKVHTTGLVKPSRLPQRIWLQGW